MPWKAPKPCGYPGCRELTAEQYCAAHKRKVASDYNRYQRNKPVQSFYESAEWRQVREMKLRRDPFCEECRRANIIATARIVDHIVPISQGGSRLDMENLQSLCKPCHARKSALEGSRWGARGRSNL